MTTLHHHPPTRAKPVDNELTRLKKQQRTLAAELQRIDGKIAKLSPAIQRKKVSLVALDRILDRLANGSRPSQSLPTDFSRDNIYDDHD